MTFDTPPRGTHTRLSAHPCDNSWCVRDQSGLRIATINDALVGQERWARKIADAVNAISKVQP